MIDQRIAHLGSGVDLRKRISSTQTPLDRSAPEQRRPRRSPQQRITNRERSMRPVISAPRKQQANHRQPSSENRQTHRVASPQIRKVDIAACQRSLRSIGRKVNPQRHLRQRVLDSPPQQHQIRRTKAVVRIARKNRIAINIRPARRRIKIERHRIARSRRGSSQQQPQTD